jgi:hypothetical protein
VVQIPSHFQHLIEEYVKQENGEEEAMFSWTNEGQDENITINLHLTGLSIDNNDKNSDVITLNIEKKRECAERFLLSHYPEALIDLTYYKTKHAFFNGLDKHTQFA